jgi:hypothetical protein
MLLAVTLPAIETSPPPSPAASSGAQRLSRLSPVEFFRGLLGMSAEERKRALAGRSAADQEVILAKLQEYESMPKAIREARLCQTELHWELSDLMKLPPAARSNRLKEVSALYRPMVDVLLKQWDEVPAKTQKALLERQSFIGLYLRMQGGTAAAQQKIIDSLPPARRAHWAEEMSRWQALPGQQRADLCSQFERFCSLSGPEQKNTVDALSEAERREMENVLQTFNRLPAAQRNQCINSFQKFATMGADERALFLKNAARWDAMTSRERQLWRELVRTLPPLPPMPPDFPPGLPPLPPDVPPLPPMPPNVTTPVVVAKSPNDAR